MKKTFEICIDDDNTEILDWIHKHFMNGNYDKFFEVTISLKEFYYNEDDEKVYVDEYIGIYDEPWIQLHSVKIFADTKDEAVNKFKQYIKSNAISTFDEQYMYVIPLFALDVI